ncbi:hypothetical protein L4C38_18470 [Vibrio kasasachensis]|uniref:hypothetical protein n=1 Tax=Vibrio kasasachensis TaxID=2910248 RepID=UPI003D0F22B5
MHAQSMRTIWLVLLTSLALIASNLVSAKTLMPIQMLQANQNASEHCATLSDMISSASMQAHHQMMNAQPSSADLDCAGDDSIQHDCCDTTCISVIATLLNHPSPLAQMSGPVSYPITATRDVVKVSSSLYRPPSA